MHDAQKSFSESGSSPPTIRAKVTSVQITLGSTISTGRALAADGSPIVFAGDWRAMLQIVEALDAGVEVYVYLEYWQVIAYRRLP
jgi:hypothetical protein